ncbi:MAG TPA: hypothetical protein VEB66_08550 [Opitutaceae bacterium]|nr:hypothetical protein [Opitutaceae bacterium]
MPSKSTLAVLLTPAVILLIPLVAMQFTAEVQWTWSDFLVMYVLMASVGGVLRFALTRSRHPAYRVAAATGCLTSFLLTWVNLAVEVIGDDNPVNALYFLVILAGLAGAGAARFEARGLARVAFGMAAAVMSVPVIALVVDPTNFSPGVLGVFVLNGIFAALFTGAGLLMWHAARNPDGGNLGAERAA